MTIRGVLMVMKVVKEERAGPILKLHLTEAEEGFNRPFASAFPCL